MSLLRNRKIWFLGLLSWLIPFLAAFAFFDADGGLAISVPLFKSLMVVIGGATGAVLLVLAFHQTRPSPAAGLVIGLLQLALNLGLDLMVLLPMSGDTVASYFADIGLRYRGCFRHLLQMWGACASSAGRQ